MTKNAKVFIDISATLDEKFDEDEFETELELLLEELVPNGFVQWASSFELMIEGQEEFTTNSKFMDVIAKGCANPECDHKHHELFLHAGCHPEAGIDAYYAEGFIHVRCAQCKEHVIRFKVR